MDRRTLLFIFGMTTIFFLMNQWFYKDSTTSNPTAIIQPNTQIVFGNNTPPSPLSAKQMEELEIVKLYKSLENPDQFLYAFHRNDVYVGISNSDKLQEEVYVSFDRLKLRVDPQEAGKPFLYSKYPLLKLEIPWIPIEDTFSASLIYFQDEKAYAISGTGHGLKDVTFNSRPSGSAFVFADIDQKSYPYAIYDTGQNQLNYLDHIPEFSDYILVKYTKDAETQKEFSDEQYYVLENNYFQLVFSNLNGALAEINLPFASEHNKSSVVHRVSFDKTIEQIYPFNNTFPQKPYLRVDSSGKQIKGLPAQGGYYPLLRRDILDYVGESLVNINPHYYGLNVFQKDLTSDVKEFALKRFEKNLIEFELSENNRKITKTFWLPEDPDSMPYGFDLDVKVAGDARNLLVSLGVPEVDLVSGNFIPTLKYRVIRNLKGKIEAIKPPKSLVSMPHLFPDWYANGNGFLGVIVDPLNETIPGLFVHPVSGDLAPSRVTIIDAQYDRFPADKYPGYSMHGSIPSKPGTTHFRVFAGPFDKNILKTVDNSFSDPASGGNPDFVNVQSTHGWFTTITKPFSQFLFILLEFFHTLTGSWGISIILLTIVLRLLLFPLNNWSMKSTAKMQKISPKVKALQDKYKKDPKRSQMEVMSLYKREGVNPFGGCLPMLLQFPFLIGMFNLLKTSFQLRGASFIPGWINDLSAPDVLFTWQYPIPLIGTSFHLLPVLNGVLMFIQQRFTSTATMKKASTDQEKQQRFMGNIFAIVITFAFYNAPSGLNIYWISNLLLGILQQWLVNKRIAAKSST